MRVTTRKQREALKRVYDRGPTYGPVTKYQCNSYLQFRRTVVLGDFGSIIIPWCGMWLGIEPDGYTHS